MRELRQITVVGMGLLGTSISLTVSRLSGGLKATGYSHRASTRQKARKLSVADEIFDNICESVSEADLVILATPVRTFESIFQKIAGSLKDGCIVTDVGSTKVLPHRWAEKHLGKNVFYVGSHPIAGSEKRGLEFARDDLFVGSLCILTRKKGTNEKAFSTVRRFWKKLGCSVSMMSPAMHDRIFSRVSHLPHIAAAALLNASDTKELKYCGKGFIDTSRVASGPPNIWTDIFISNADNSAQAIDKMVNELLKLKRAIKANNQAQIERLLKKARQRRKELINYKIKSRELLE
jgi:prephenate dehydrogenase